MDPGLRTDIGETYAQMLLALNGIHCDLQLLGGVKKGLLGVKKEQNYCTKISYTGINWGVSETE